MGTKKICNYDCFNCKYPDCINDNKVNDFEFYTQKVRGDLDVTESKLALRAKRNEKTREFKRQGLCTTCGKRPARDGGALCQECLERERTRKSKNKQAGLCVLCNAPTLNGKSRCEACLQKAREKRKAKTQERREKGLCIYCGKPANGKKCCQECLDKIKNKRKEKKQNEQENNM